MHICRNSEKQAGGTGELTHGSLTHGVGKRAIKYFDAKDKPQTTTNYPKPPNLLYLKLPETA